MYPCFILYIMKKTSKKPIVISMQNEVAKEVWSNFDFQFFRQDVKEHFFFDKNKYVIYDHLRE